MGDEGGASHCGSSDVWLGLQQPYSDWTTIDDLDVSAAGPTACVFMGAQQTATSTYDLGAFCDADKFKPTAALNQVVESRGVQWYMLPGKSTGYACPPRSGPKPAVT